MVSNWTQPAFKVKGMKPPCLERDVSTNIIWNTSIRKSLLQPFISYIAMDLYIFSLYYNPTLLLLSLSKHPQHINNELYHYHWLIFCYTVWNLSAFYNEQIQILWPGKKDNIYANPTMADHWSDYSYRPVQYFFPRVVWDGAAVCSFGASLTLRTGRAEG